MNSAGICREPIENARKCGLHFGHDGAHQCCDLHKPIDERYRR